MPQPWTEHAVFYHVYALGALGAPSRNSFANEVSDRLASFSSWLDDLQELGVNAVLLGPVFESTTHGYDVSNYFRVDRRLGDEAALVALARDLHSRDMRLILDTVFHHTGRDFFAFIDVLQNGAQSTYRDWYNLDFSRRSRQGDPFFYEGWNGHYDLVKLNLRNPAVREHLFGAFDWWVDTFAVDGLRLDEQTRRTSLSLLALDPTAMRARGSQPDLRRVIQRLFTIRRERAALRSGAYTRLHVAAQQFAFARGDGRDAVTVAVNASPAPHEIKIATSIGDGAMVDVLNDGMSFPIAGGCCSIPLDPHRGRVLVYART